MAFGSGCIMTGRPPARPVRVVPGVGSARIGRQPATTGSTDRSFSPERTRDAQRSPAWSPAAVWCAPGPGTTSARSSSCCLSRSSVLLARWFWRSWGR